MDRLVDCLSATLGHSTRALGVVASSKGLWSGRLMLHMHDGTRLQGFSPTERGAQPELLVPDSHALRALQSDAQWIAVVEKDAVFRRVRGQEARLRPLLEGHGVLVTVSYGTVLSAQQSSKGLTASARAKGQGLS